MTGAQWESWRRNHPETYEAWRRHIAKTLHGRRVGGRKAKARSICANCRERMADHAGLCNRCYQARARLQAGVPYQGRRIWWGVKVCRECGGKAWNRGLCRACYARWWRRHSKRAVEIEMRRQAKLRFGGHQQVLDRIAKGCERCGMTNEEHKLLYGSRLNVHHVDHNGILSGHPNHDPDNILILCSPCHRKVHAEERKAVTA